MRLIALITDFGLKDPYVGVMKAVIKSINPGVEVVDITHMITRHDVIEAAVALLVSARYFPRETIFVAVVDPGVGSERRPILIESNNYILIGPDNGVLTLLAERDGVKRVFEITNSAYMLGDLSYTFHGRDVFAPVAAYVSKGIPLESVGKELKWDQLVKIEVSKPAFLRDNSHTVIKASALYIDVFGNVMTNVEKKDLVGLEPRYGSLIKLFSKTGIHRCIYERTFSRVPEGELACYINSWGYLEVAVNKGDASKKLGVSRGDIIEFYIEEHVTRA